MTNADVVRRFEDEFKNRNNLDIVDELMADGFVHHAPFPGLPEGRAGMKAIGQFVTGALGDIRVSVDLVVAEGDFVADRVSAQGVRKDTREPTSWVENHIYRLASGLIVEWWPAGGPNLG
jgi:predicted SnoaL-like aldol condensation-catalyzing enzyme